MKNTKLWTILIAIIMVLTMIPTIAFATTNNTVYEGTGWPYSTYYVAKLTVSEVEISYVDGTDIYLDNKTEKNAQFTLTATAGGSRSGNLGINWNDDETNTKTYTTNLVDGKATVEVYAYKASGAGVGRNGTKTFNFYIAEPNKNPTLANGVSGEINAAVTSGDSYELNLGNVFVDADKDELSYTVTVDGGNATKAETVYSYLNEIPGTYTLKFTATDGKTAADKQPTYTVNLTVKNSETTYDVKVKTPESISPEFYAVNTINNGAVVKGDKLVYNNGTVKVPENISRIMWEAYGMIGFSAPVSSDMEIEIVKVKLVTKFDDGETDDSAQITITDSEGVKTAGTSADVYLLPAVAGFTYKATPSNSQYNAVELKDQMPVTGNIEMTFIKKHFTVIAPKGSVVSAGTLSGSFKYSFKTLISTEPKDDTVVYKFEPLSGNAFVRVQRPGDEDAVTYWDWKSSKADGQTITITEEQLFMNDSGEDMFDDDTVYRNFEKFEMDLGDIYMNINNQGYINLNVGESKGLNMFRNWQAIESFLNSKISLPDFDYEIISIEGDNVISIEPDEKNSAAATLTANSVGTAIVLVTYDAMYSDSTVGSSGGNAGGGNRYSAIWPDRTGVFVVSVGKDGTAIKSNMTCNGAVFDAEHSPQFYTGDEGASVSFKPEEGVTVTVNRSTVGDETLSFGSFTDKGVIVAEDGTVTVDSLKTGRHIIKLEKDGVESYQVVTAQQTTVQYLDAKGNDLGENPSALPGETITVKIKGLTNPAEKFATKYNFNAQITYKDQNGNTYKNSSGTGYGRYNFSSQVQTVEVTIPVGWTEKTLTLDGYIQMGGFAGDGIGSHRKVTYGTASGMATGEGAGMMLGTLPTLTIDTRTDAQKLEDAKTDAKSELAEYKNADDYREVQQVELAEAIDKANAAIDAAETIEEVDEALSAGKAVMDEIKTDAQLKADENEAVVKVPTDTKETTESEATDEETVEEDETAETGDEGMIWLWAVLMMLSLGGVVTVYTVRKRKA